MVSLMSPINSKNPQAMELTPQRWLRLSFMIWGALLMGQIVFLGVVIFLRSSGQQPMVNQQTAQLLLIIASAMIFTVIPFGYIIRRSSFLRAADKEEKVKLGMLFGGNLVFWAACEGISLFGIVGFLVGGLWLNLIPSLVAFIIQLHHSPRLPGDSIFPSITQSDVHRP